MTNDKAELFHSLHRDQRPLVLTNAWDVASARIVEEAGAAAVATTSAGVAWSLGAPDGDKLARDLAVDTIARIAAAVGVPVTADIEGGYAEDPEGVAETVRMVIDAGAVGINLEDADYTGAGPLLAPEKYAARVAAARSAADRAGVRLYINARIDVCLRGVGASDGRLADTLARAAAYLAAGADGVFVPGVVDPETITALVKEVDAPLNVLAGYGSLPVPTLGELGVARVSTGGRLAEVAYTAARRAAEEVLGAGTYGVLAGAMTHNEMNRLIQ